MAPRARLIPSLGAILLAGGPLLMLAGCGEPPQPLPSSPPYSARPSAGPPGSISSVPGVPRTTATPFPAGLPPTPAPGQLPGYPANPGPIRTTTAPTTVSPRPTPKQAPKCTGEPTGQQILALIKGKPGVPALDLTVLDGPYCASSWSFTTVGVAGKTIDQQDPLYVVAVGTGADLALVTAGSDVCNAPVQQQAPPGIRVLGCGF